MSENVIKASDASFAEEIETDLPVLVDFWAEWCGPCRALGPVLDEIADEYQGKAKIVKINVDDNKETAMKFQVMSIPTMVFIKNGQEVDKLVGALPKEQITEKLDSMA